MNDAARVRREVRDAVGCALGVTLLGIVLGLLWVWLAPRIPLFTDGQAVYLKDPEGEEAVGADGTFVLLSLALGAVAGGAVFLARRKGGVGLVLGLACGGLLAAVVGWRLGVMLGPESDVVAAAKAAGKGNTFEGPLELTAKGALLAMPFGAVLFHLALTGVFGPRDPEPGTMDDLHDPAPGPDGAPPHR
ncbi:hypothetical protein HCC30_10020 [Streptomyces sp. HNM0574]|nr:hypothetical protein [Streptomyces sp. HNM0574]